jgi:hypothetical protein
MDTLKKVHIFILFSHSTRGFITKMLLLNFLFSINKILGLIGFQFERDKKSFVMNKIQLWYSKAIMLTAILIYPYCAYSMITKDLLETNDAVENLGIVAEYIQYYVIVLTVFYSYGSKQSEIKKTLNKCVNIMKSLQLYRKALRIDFVVVLINTLVLFHISLLLNIYVTDANYDKVLCILSFWPDIVIHCTVLNFMVIFVLIKHFLKKLNVLLLAEVHKIHARKSLVMELTICDQLDDLLAIYEKLAELCDDVNRIFSELLLLLMGHFFVIMVTQVIVMQGARQLDQAMAPMVTDLSDYFLQ